MNFRTRGGIDPNLWNQFWGNVEADLQDTIAEARSHYLGVSGFAYTYEVALSGIAGKEDA